MACVFCGLVALFFFFFCILPQSTTFLTKKKKEKGKFRNCHGVKVLVSFSVRSAEETVSFRIFATKIELPGGSCSFEQKSKEFEREAIPKGLILRKICV